MCCTLISSLLYPFLNHRGSITAWKLLYARGNREMELEYPMNLYGQLQFSLKKIKLLFLTFL